MGAFPNLEGEVSLTRGKEVLINAVALTIPLFAMSYFKIPNILCLELESFMTNFWWGQKNFEKKIHSSVGRSCVFPNLRGALVLRT